MRQRHQCQSHRAQLVAAVLVALLYAANWLIPAVFIPAYALAVTFGGLPNTAANWIQGDAATANHSSPLLGFENRARPLISSHLKQHYHLDTAVDRDAFAPLNTLSDSEVYMYRTAVWDFRSRANFSLAAVTTAAELKDIRAHADAAQISWPAEGLMLLITASKLKEQLEAANQRIAYLAHLGQGCQGQAAAAEQNGSVHKGWRSLTSSPFFWWTVPLMVLVAVFAARPSRHDSRALCVDALLREASRKLHARKCTSAVDTSSRMQHNGSVGSLHASSHVCPQDSVWHSQPHQPLPNSPQPACSKFQASNFGALPLRRPSERQAKRAKLSDTSTGACVAKPAGLHSAGAHHTGANLAFGLRDEGKAAAAHGQPLPIWPLSTLSFVKGYSPGMVPKFGRFVRRGRKMNGAEASLPETPRSNVAAAIVPGVLGMSPLVAQRLAGRLRNVHNARVSCSSDGLSSADTSARCSPVAGAGLSEVPGLSEDPIGLPERHARSECEVTAASPWVPMTEASLSSNSTSQPGTPEAQPPMIQQYRSTFGTESVRNLAEQRLDRCRFEAFGAAGCGSEAPRAARHSYEATTVLLRKRSGDTDAAKGLSQDSDSNSSTSNRDYDSSRSPSVGSLQSLAELPACEVYPSLGRWRHGQGLDREPNDCGTRHSMPEASVSVGARHTPRNAARNGNDVTGGCSIRRWPPPGAAESGRQMPLGSPGLMARLTSDEVARLQGFTDGAQASSRALSAALDVTDNCPETAAAAATAVAVCACAASSAADVRAAVAAAALGCAAASVNQLQNRLDSLHTELATRKDDVHTLKRQLVNACTAPLHTEEDLAAVKQQVTELEERLQAFHCSGFISFF